MDNNISDSLQETAPSLDERSDSDQSKEKEIPHNEAETKTRRGGQAPRRARGSRRGQVPKRKRLRHVKKHKSKPPTLTPGTTDNVVNADSTCENQVQDVVISSVGSSTSQLVITSSSVASIDSPESSTAVGGIIKLPQSLPSEGILDSIPQLFTDTMASHGDLTQASSSTGNIASLQETLSSRFSYGSQLGMSASYCVLPTHSVMSDACKTSISAVDIAKTPMVHLIPTSELPSGSSSIQPFDLFMEVRQKVEAFLYSGWKVIVYPTNIHVVVMSAQDNITVQRNLVFCANGEVDLFVHCESVCVKQFLQRAPSAVQLSPNTVNEFVDRIVKIINTVSEMEVCSGCDDESFRVAWDICGLGEVYKNPYRECRYSETFRSVLCLRLVRRKTWRCLECSKVLKSLKRRAALASVKEPNLCTPNIYLSEEQKLSKLQEQQKKFGNAKRQLIRLKEKIQTLIQKVGVTIDDQLSDDLMGIINKHSVSPAHSIFLQQQIKASQSASEKKKKGMRWHPTIIRLALSLHITSPAAYELLRDTGMVRLPSSRTLLDYARVKPAKDGIDTVVLESLARKAENFKHKHQKYHVLMADEMYVSQNLVSQKSTGRMVGYTNLDDVDQGVKNLEDFLNDVSENEQEPVIAQKVLVYMIKGVSSGIKEVVATYAVGNVSVNQMYVWTWQVIGSLERSGIAVIAMVTDGFSLNRDFVRKHIPVTLLESGVIFDTINLAAPDRVLFFFSDVPHLLKTIRNCLYSSRSANKKGRRRMMRNGKQITWDPIIRLYESNKKRNLRKSFKLNPMNVYPDSYARMKVKYAAEIISRTVAQDLEDQGWDDASELIVFLRHVNDWFDCLNGAHTSVGKKKRNENLLPYCSKDDRRFASLLSFLEYLDNWTQEAQGAHATVNATATSDLQNSEAKEAESSMDAGEEGVDPDEDTPANQRTLSRQTLQGVEMTTRAFISAVRFLLDEGVGFLNARVFTQDPLEQHFSKLRAGQGGSNNPNVGQVLNRNRALHTIGQLGMKRRRGNAGQCEDFVEVTEEPLTKRKSSRAPKICEVFE